MKINARIALGVVAATAMLLFPVARGQDNPYRLKPGASGKVCLDCHVDFEDTLKMAAVHTPVEGGDCTGCHNPHASAHGKLLSAAPGDVCSECHDGLVPADARSAHEAAASGECLACHDAHATDNPNVLIAAGNELCAGCHKDLAGAVEAARFKHSPVGKGCLSCHEPHASTGADFLLRAEQPALCLECHDAKRASFVERHMGYPVERALCSSCHDPHGSSSPGMLWATVHRPVDTRMCRQCHLDAASPDALQTKAGGIELCRGCHSKMVNETMAKKSLHGPLTDKASCQHCHSPHASKHAGLLIERLDVGCGKCHGDTLARIQQVEFKHMPVEEGECTTCHSPHSSNSAFLLQGENTIALCGECHDWESHSTHPIGEDIVDQRNANLTVDCLSCHFSHGSDHKFLAPYDAASDLCVDCHQKLGR